VKFGADPFVRNQYLKSVGAMVTAGLLVNGLAKAAGATVSTNRFSSDFMKPKFENTRIDPWAGFQQYLTTFSNTVAEIKKHYGDGQRGGFEPTPALAKFAWWKLNPAIASGVRVIFGKDPVTGQPTKFGLGTDTETENLLYPMFIDDVVHMIKDDPQAFPKAIPLSILNWYGMGTSAYEMNTPRNPMRLPGLTLPSPR